METNRGNTSSAHATHASAPTKQPQNSVKYDNLQGSNFIIKPVSHKRTLCAPFKSSEGRLKQVM